METPRSSCLLRTAGCSNREIAAPLHRTIGAVKKRFFSTISTLHVLHDTRAVLRTCELCVLQ